MEEHVVKILKVEPVTHNVRRFTVEKPAGYHFIPGQATELSINKPLWTDQKRPFTFTSLNSWPDLEFTIKIYNDHDGVTRKLGTLKNGDELILRDPWGAIQYQGEGVFIAGGAGVTPFIAIFRQLHQEHRLGGNRLLFANKTSRDIILKEEFLQMLGDRFINILSEEETREFEQGKINGEWLKSRIPDLHSRFYICGPDQMVKDIQDCLRKLGVSGEAITVEL